MSQNDQFEQLFELRRSVARIGEADWMGWWESNALNVAGQHLLPRIFPRTATVTAAQVAIAAARAQQDPLLPREPRVHLFDFGEEVEAAFEQWLADRKQERWSPESPPAEAGDASSGAAALGAMGFEAGEESAETDGGGFLLLGEVDPMRTSDPERLLEIANRLATAYAKSTRGGLVVPYFRVTS